MFDFCRSELEVEIFTSFRKPQYWIHGKSFNLFFKIFKINSFFFGSSLYLPGTYLEPPLLPMSMGYKKDIITG